MTPNIPSVHAKCKCKPVFLPHIASCGCILYLLSSSEEMAEAPLIILREIDFPLTSS